MEHVVGILVGMGVLLGALSFVVKRTRSAHRSRGEFIPLEPRSLVRVIEDEEELQDAAHRAAQFDRDAAERLLSRADRYEAVAVTKPITDIRESRRLTSHGGADDTSRTA